MSLSSTDLSLSSNFWEYQVQELLKLPADQLTCVEEIYHKVLQDPAALPKELQGEEQGQKTRVFCYLIEEMEKQLNQEQQAAFPNFEKLELVKNKITALIHIHLEKEASCHTAYPIAEEVEEEECQWALKQGYHHTTLSLLQHPRLSGRVQAYSLLQRAIQEKNIPMLELLFEKFSDFSFHSQQASSLLFQAIQEGFLQGVILLLEKGVSPDRGDEYKNTPLMQAFFYEKTEIAQAILQAGANPNKLNENGNSALSIAAYKGNVEGLGLLLEKEADPRIGNDVQDLCIDPFSSGDQVPLLEVGDLTPLMIALFQDNNEVARLLIQAGGLLDQAWGEEYQSELHLAIRLGNEEMAQAFVEAGAQVNFIDAKGNTPLLTAISHGASLDFIQYLIEKGADVDFVNHKEKSALVKAMKGNLHSIVEVLIDAGAACSTSHNQVQVYTRRLQKEKKNFLLEKLKTAYVMEALDKDLKVLFEQKLALIPSLEVWTDRQIVKLAHFIKRLSSDRLSNPSLERIKELAFSQSLSPFSQKQLQYALYHQGLLLFDAKDAMKALKEPLSLNWDPSHYQQKVLGVGVEAVNEEVDVLELIQILGDLNLTDGIIDDEDDEDIVRPASEWQTEFRTYLRLLKNEHYELSDYYQEKVGKDLTAKVRSIIKHLILHIKKHPENAEHIIKRLAAMFFHCADRIATEMQDLYTEYVFPDLKGKSLEARSLKNKLLEWLYLQRLELLQQLGSIQADHHPACTQRFIRKHLGPEFGVSDEIVGAGTDLFSVHSKVQFKDLPQKRKEFLKAYQPENILKKLEQSLIYGNASQLAYQEVKRWFKDFGVKEAEFLQLDEEDPLKVSFKKEALLFFLELHGYLQSEKV